MNAFTKIFTTLIGCIFIQSVYSQTVDQILKNSDYYWGEGIGKTTAFKEYVNNLVKTHSNAILKNTEILSWGEESEEPVIHIRTWQPDKDPDFGLYDISNF